jgi:hypothetical protein
VWQPVDAAVVGAVADAVQRQQPQALRTRRQAADSAADAVVAADSARRRDRRRA